MRILIAVHGFPPTHSAGAERQAERMARWLMNNGHHVEVFAIEKVNEPTFHVDTNDQDGIIVHRIYYDLAAGPDIFRNSYDNPQIGAALRELLSERPFDVVHLISGYLLGSQVVSVAKEMGFPVVVSPMEFWFMCARLNLMQITGKLCIGPETDQKCMRCLMEDKRRFRRPAEVAPTVMNAFWAMAQHMPFTHDMIDAVTHRREHLKETLDSADVVICNSQFLIWKFQEFGFDTQNFRYIRQGLTTTALAEKPSVENKSDTLRLGYIGQIKQHKGVDLLIKAVSTLLDEGKNVSLDLWGDENEIPEYTAQWKEYSAAYPSIRWNGRYVGSKVWDVIAGFDVLVVPSRWYENSPNVILEAFEMGRPAIVTNLGGMAELVEHNVNGLVFDLNSTTDLRHQIERLLVESTLLQRLQDAIPPVKRIDEEMYEVVAQYERLAITNSS